MNNIASKLNGNWISTEEIELLNYNSNFGNWIDFVGIPGYYKFELDLSFDGPKNCQLKIPVMTPGGLWYFPLYHGRFDRKGKYVLIWQNEEVPVRIEYELQGEILSFSLFGRKIKFKKNTEQPKPHR
ncbi:MAG: hypothetical protein R2824_15810 [Saprospiraceae bacterium]|nr:hypothetical protein [Lewinella sp.]